MKVDFWFDSMCPWAWMTSRWFLEVEKVRKIDLVFHVFSLGHLNRETTDKKYQTLLPKSWRANRIIMAAKEAYGQSIVLPLYTAIGKNLHIKKMEFDENLFKEALLELELPILLLSEIDNEAWDLAIIESHDRGLALVGSDLGVPIISINGEKNNNAFFGPVLSPAPKGEAAGRLWDGLVIVSSFPGFFELKRSRIVGPIFD